MLLHVPSMAVSFKRPVEPIPSWLFDDDSKDGLEEDPDKPPAPWRDSVDVAGRIDGSTFPVVIEEVFPPSTYDPGASWLLRDDL